jgi:hypothetical protein
MTIAGGSTIHVFNNAGTFNKIIPNVTSSISATFNNLATGVMNVEAGTLSLSGGTNSGVINAGAGADLSLGAFQNHGVINYRGTKLINSNFTNSASG